MKTSKSTFTELTFEMSKLNVMTSGNEKLWKKPNCIHQRNTSN